MSPKSSGKTKPSAAAKPRRAGQPGRAAPKAAILSSQVVFSGSVFRVHRDIVIEPSGKRAERDIIRHNGSAVILAVDNSKSKKDPWIVMERQYRHAANQFLWELPAGKIDPGETPLEGAKRELAEETGYTAKKWWPLVEYFASPGFLGEAMKVFVAEGLQAGEARPEEDEAIELRLVKLSEILKMIEKDAIRDGKTITGILVYERLRNRRGKR